MERVSGDSEMRKMGEYQDQLIERLSDCKAAITHFQVALNEYEKDRDAPVFLLALQNIIQAQGKESNLAPYVYIVRCFIHLSIGQYDDAREDYDVILELDPENEHATYLANACGNLWKTENRTILAQSTAVESIDEMGLTEEVISARVQRAAENVLSFH